MIHDQVSKFFLYSIVYFQKGKSDQIAISESYREDYRDAQKFETVPEQEEFYQNMKSGAESGWDYSTRWWELLLHILLLKSVSAITCKLRCYLDTYLLKCKKVV